jgi:antitoxin ChpS
MSAAKVQKWGNSMALRIPATMLRSLGLAEGQAVALSVENGALVARPAQKRYTLAALLAECDFSKPMTAEEREWIDAAPVGLEEI